MAEVVTLREGGRESVNIAQVKEVQRLTLEYLAGFSIFSIWKLIRKVRKEARI